MQPQFLHFPPIEKHGVIGDRRTAALSAADGTIDWFCVPDYDDHVVLGALLDPERGGYFRFGPERLSLGDQRYRGATVCLMTCWREDGRRLVLSDLMPGPSRDRAKGDENSRVILRRLRAEKRTWRVQLNLQPRWNLADAPRVQACGEGARFQFAKTTLICWASFPIELQPGGVRSDFVLKEGEEAWVMFGLEQDPTRWNVHRCRTLHDQTNRYWRKWCKELKSFSVDRKRLHRSALTVHLLAHAPNDAVVSAATTSLPERIGGDRNYDYRYTWVRDASVSAAFLAIMGGSAEVAHYFEWLSELHSSVDAPLQVCYRTNGQTILETRELKHAIGYRESQPVRFGNRAYKQRQLGSFGWYADSALIFLKAGGEWRPSFWPMLRRTADYVCKAWREPDNGIWELPQQAHYVASKIMAWVTLDRTLCIAERLGQTRPQKWKQTKEAIRREVLTKGWSEKRRSFRQRYDSEAIDAASLLIPLMDFLPGDDPRVLDTIAAIERELMIDGLVYRFDPSATLGGKELPLGEFEGAFLPATFWYAHALARAGRIREAKRGLKCCEVIAGGPGIFAEEADPKGRTFLGNTPLLLAQVEYGRAILAIRSSEQKASPNEQKNL